MGKVHAGREKNDGSNCRRSEPGGASQVQVSEDMECVILDAAAYKCNGREILEWKPFGNLRYGCECLAVQEVQARTT
jgi:hypothetical protein